MCSLFAWSALLSCNSESLSAFSSLHLWIYPAVFQWKVFLHTCLPALQKNFPSISILWYSWLNSSSFPCLQPQPCFSHLAPPFEAFYTLTLDFSEFWQQIFPVKPVHAFPPWIDHLTSQLHLRLLHSLRNSSASHLLPWFRCRFLSPSLITSSCLNTIVFCPQSVYFPSSALSFLLLCLSFSLHNTIILQSFLS